MLSTSSAAASLLTVLSLALSPPGESQGSSEPEEASSLAPAADLGLVEGPATETSGSTSASVQGEELPKMDPKNRAMVLSGDVLVAAGVGSFLASVVGAALRADARERITYTLDDPERMQERADLEQRERTGGLLFIGAGSAAGALLISGVTLIVLGNKRERERREALEAQRAQSFRLLPTVELGSTGASTQPARPLAPAWHIGLSGRF